MEGVLAREITLLLKYLGVRTIKCPSMDYGMRAEVDPEQVIA
jgi:hypothetical protein